MGYRREDVGLFEMINDLRQRIGKLESNQGIRQNDIRLGDWVCSVDDAGCIKALNIKTNVLTSTCDCHCGQTPTECVPPMVTFPLPSGGAGPIGICYDGLSIWTANHDSASVSQISTTTGAGTTTALSGSVTNPTGLVFDGYQIWVSCQSGGGKMVAFPPYAPTGQTIRTFPVSATPDGLVFVSPDIVITGTSSPNLFNLVNSPTSPSVTSYWALPHSDYFGITKDGSGNLWLGDNVVDVVSRVNISTGAVFDIALPAGSAPDWLTFDGYNIWTANTGTNSVSRINVSTFTVTQFPVGSAPRGVVYDGQHIWSANSGEASICRINPVTGVTDTYTLPGGASTPDGITFDGTYIWTANYTTDSVTRIGPLC